MIIKFNEDGVCGYENGCFSEYFFCLEMYQNNIFFIFLKLFLILVHKNDLKNKKNLIF